MNPGHEGEFLQDLHHSFRWGDRAGVVISKIPAESVYGRRQRLACYVPMSGGERQIRHFFSAFILMYTVSFIYFYYLHNRVTNANMRII